MNRKRPNQCTDCAHYANATCTIRPSISLITGFPFKQTLCQWFKVPVVEKVNPWATPRL